MFTLGICAVLPRSLSCGAGLRAGLAPRAPSQLLTPFYCRYHMLMVLICSDINIYANKSNFILYIRVLLFRKGTCFIPFGFLMIHNS